MPYAFDLACVDGTRFEKLAQSVGELNFAGAIAFDRGKREMWQGEVMAASTGEPVRFLETLKA